LCQAQDVYTGGLWSPFRMQNAPRRAELFCRAECVRSEPERAKNSY